MLSRSFSFALAGMAVFVAACASSSTTGAAHPAVASAPPVVPVPSDPLALVPPDAQTFFTLDVAAVVKARSFDSWRNAATRYACIPKDDIDWATSSTTRMIFVTRGTHPKTEVLGVLVGKYTEPDVLRAIRLVQRLDAKQDNTGESAQRGRFTVTTLGSLSGAQLEGRILLVGSTAMVQSAIDLIEAPPAAPFATTEPFKHLSAQLACDHHSVCAVIAPSSEGTRVLKRLLANVNMAELGKRLVGVASGMSADLESGLAFSTVSEMASADDAAVAQKQLNDWLWQLGVVARFAGFPDVIDEIKVQVEGSKVGLHLAIDQATLAKLQDRVSGMLDDTDFGCSPPPTAATAPAAATAAPAAPPAPAAP